MSLRDAVTGCVFVSLSNDCNIVDVPHFCILEFSASSKSFLDEFGLSRFNCQVVGVSF